MTPVLALSASISDLRDVIAWGLYRRKKMTDDRPLSVVYRLLFDLRLWICITSATKANTYI